MTPLTESLMILGVLLVSALLGIGASLMLPDSHRTDSTRTHFAATVSVVATLTALVLGLAFSNANAARVSMMQDVGLLSSGIVRADTQLRDFGADAAPARATLAQFARQKLQDLFPGPQGGETNTGNPATAALLDQLQSQILALTPHTEAEKWRQSQALSLTADIETARWAIAEQSHVAMPIAALIVISFWLAVLYGTYGFFMPRHGTAVVALVLSAMAVAGAILMILEARTPFAGVVRISDASLVEAVATVGK